MGATKKLDHSIWQEAAGSPVSKRDPDAAPRAKSVGGRASRTPRTPPKARVKPGKLFIQMYGNAFICVIALVDCFALATCDLLVSRNGVH